MTGIILFLLLNPVDQRWATVTAGPNVSYFEANVRKNRISLKKRWKGRDDRKEGRKKEKNIKSW
jgi:hypothetical protein